jgi:hypothetical protein
MKVEGRMEKNAEDESSGKERDGRCVKDDV